MFLYNSASECVGLALGAAPRAQHEHGVAGIQSALGVADSGKGACLDRFLARNYNPKSDRVCFRTWETKRGPVAVLSANDSSPCYWRDRAVRAARENPDSCGSAWSDHAMAVWASGVRVADLASVAAMLAEHRAIVVDGAFSCLVEDMPDAWLHCGVIIADLASLPPMGVAEIEGYLEREQAQISFVAAIKLPRGAVIEAERKRDRRFFQMEFSIRAGDGRGRLSTLCDEDGRVTCRMTGLGAPSWQSVTTEEVSAACFEAFAASAKPAVGTPPAKRL